MAYTSGMLRHIISIAKRKDDGNKTFGKSGQPTYEILGDFHAAEDFNRGTKALRMGAFDAYDIVMFRMRFNKDIDRWCLIKFRGKWYQILSLNEDFHDNQIQITAQELTNQKVNIVQPYSTGELGESTPGDI